jgi:hypothetical protein
LVRLEDALLDRFLCVGSLVARLGPLELVEIELFLFLVDQSPREPLTRRLVEISEPSSIGAQEDEHVAAMSRRSPRVSRICAARSRASESAVFDECAASGPRYAIMQKQYGNAPADEARRYSPAVCTGVDVREVCGLPDHSKIGTSYVERQNLTMRMGMRRFTRLTNAFSKKIENHAHAVSLHFMHYNFARKHQTLGQTPAMAAGIERHPWSLTQIAELLD